jgi:hypothetical protein
MFRPITTVAGIVSVTAALVNSSGRLPAQEVIRLEGQPLSVTPVLERENRAQAFGKEADVRLPCRQVRRTGQKPQAVVIYLREG